MSHGTPITIIRMKAEHLPEVMDIENASFTGPWSEDAWRAEFAFHESNCYVCIDAQGVVVAYIAFRITLDEGHIMKLAVRPAFRNKGLATALVRTGLKKMREAGVRSVFLELRESNIKAAAFYRKLGFKVEGKRKGYYCTPSENAVLMRRAL